MSICFCFVRLRDVVVDLDMDWLKSFSASIQALRGDEDAVWLLPFSGNHWKPLSRAVV